MIRFTKEQRELLGEYLKGLSCVVVNKTWYFCGRAMNCGDGCCHDAFDSYEEALDNLEMYARSYDEITIEEL